jgi:two-component system response regulator FixJ
MSAPCICVVDDDEAVRDSLCALLESAGHAARVFGSAKEFLGARETLTCVCLIADIRMPDMDGLTLQEELTRLHAGIPVVIVTGHGDVALAVRAMKAGAVDFIEKPFDDETLLGAANRALAAGRDTRGKSPGSDEAAAKVTALSAREKQVLERLVAGKANKVIAFELGISPRTVEIHRANVMDKMQARSLSELVRLALAAGVDIGPEG